MNLAHVYELITLECYNLYMPKILKRYISIDPDILGGAPVVKGTRIPVERVFKLVDQGYDLSKFKEEFPQVHTEIIQSLISYLMREGLNAFTKNT